MPATLHHAQEYIRQELSPAALESAQPLIRFVSSIEDAVREADLAIDCVPDELESKLEIIWLLDRMSPPRTVIATPTAQLSHYILPPKMHYERADLPMFVYESFIYPEPFTRYTAPILPLQSLRVAK